MLVLKVTFRGNSLKEFAQHYLTDLGQMGMFVRTRSPLPVGTKLRFEFRLENDIPLLVGQGIVLWVSEENRELQIPCGMELRFDSLSPESENHFQWLQLEKRGVTVGTEVPLYIATSTTASDPTDTAGKDSSDPDPGRITPARGARALGGRTLQGIKAPAAAEASRSTRPPTGPLPVVSHVERAPTGPVRAITHVERAPTGPVRAITHVGRAPTGPVRAITHVERAPTGPVRAIAETLPVLAEDGRATQPYLRGPEAEERSRLPVLARRGADEGLTGYRPSEPLGPGDSDPAKMFSQVAPRESQTGRRLDGAVGRDTLLTIHELAGRRFRLVGVVLVGVGLIALVVWWLARTPAPSLVGQGQSSGLRLVRVTSVPVGAEVVLEGRSAGRTPVELPTGGEPMLQVQHEGYQTEVVTVSRLDPRWRTEGGRQVLELKVTLARAAVGAPDAAAIDAAPEPRRRRPLPEAKKPGPRAKQPEPEAKPEPEVKQPEPEAKQPEPEVKQPEPEVKKPEPEAKKPEAKKPVVKTPDWASKPEAKPEKQEKKVKQPGWAD